MQMQVAIELIIAAGRALSSLENLRSQYNYVCGDDGNFSKRFELIIMIFEFNLRIAWRLCFGKV